MATSRTIILHTTDGATRQVVYRRDRPPVVTVKYRGRRSV